MFHIKEPNYFNRTKNIVRDLFPWLDDRAATYVCNKIGNELRNCSETLYLVELLDEPFPEEDGYFSHFDLACVPNKLGASQPRVSVYAQITVD